MRAWFAAVGLLSLLLALPLAAEEILVFAAASLTESLQEIGKSYVGKTGIAVSFSFGSSSDLARQIEAGAPADVFFSADTAKMDSLEKAVGLLGPLAAHCLPVAPSWHGLRTGGRHVFICEVNICIRPRERPQVPKA